MSLKNHVVYDFCCDCFVNGASRFADHLKNTEYKWPFWKHWCNVVELQPDNAQRVFVANVLAALVKLSYTDRFGPRHLSTCTFGVCISDKRARLKKSRQTAQYVLVSLCCFPCAETAESGVCAIAEYAALCHW